MILFEEIERIKWQGYNEENARAKLGQDIILKAIADSGMARNTTIKGGVVMRSISGEKRRATKDFDLDFIRLSISNDSIRKFIQRLNCIEGIVITLEGRIQELNHQDYKGKRIFIAIADNTGTSISLKMDIGVHKDLSIEQEEYAFDVGFQEDKVSLLINSPAQMITEKLKSMVRFGTRNTRYKDVFDICYLSDLVKMDKLTDCIKKYIIQDETLRSITKMDDIILRVERVFTSKDYLRELQKSDKNWLDISVEEVLEKDLEFLRSIKL